MNRNQSITTIALSTLIAIGSVSFAVKATNRSKSIVDENADLRRQLADLQHQPGQAESEKITGTETEPETTNTVAALKAPENDASEPAPRPQRESFTDRMARMKEEDPEGYAEWIKRRSEFQEKMKYNLAERTATFMDLDTSKMTPEELAAHEQLVERMGSIWDLMEQLGNPEEMNREAMRELFHEARDVRPLMEQERSTMFRMLGEDLGYSGQEAVDFADHVDSIISSTSIQMPHGGGRGGR